MLFSSITIKDNEVETRNDSYHLENLTVVSARRELLGAGLLVATTLAGFGLAFADILWPAEKIGIALVCGISLWTGLTIGRLRFHSRDLSGSELSGVIWGTYGHLNRKRREIAAAIRAAKSGGTA
ncbi:hypothetical protein [Thalassovita sp.]|uniref:hypothetical protein n=1 Tax=Thalassovita sp. TaxID=1979401 RepID=UPI0028823BF4|nr:hypothetical protein [Thalassovita sp.]MDF1803194.1 hypothetical protein [Thalassovita sp.]